MSDSLSTTAAIDATRALAERLGITSAPVVLADRSHLVLELPPTSIVARVALATSTTRVGLEWIAREVAVARHLDAASAPVTRPVADFDAGPHSEGDFYVSFWRREVREGVLDPGVAGRGLAAVHRALASFDASALPEWGVMHESRGVLSRACENGILDESEARRLRRGFEMADELMTGARARTASFQAVHGDAHLGNVFPTTRGPLWTDWEDACAAPIEWDLATFTARHVTFGEESDLVLGALATYDVDHDPDLVRDLVPLRNLQVIPWLVVFAERQPELAERARARLAHVDV